MEEGPQNITDLTADEESKLFNLDSSKNSNDDESVAEHQYENAVLSLPL
eukprot:CAMPEP_0196582144 /NCGR_PEP_ID=MMETSP1081-20130531/37665_1 /TAXON_ID=36882 /ORGANISM="Pyramimonas amylifera, Strain CCMP720" /LENGTH=48 /DNA_ID= /DNA_START= /DNA_END= /DNA_ORIENTATION=